MKRFCKTQLSALGGVETLGFKKFLFRSVPARACCHFLLVNKIYCIKTWRFCSAYTTSSKCLLISTHSTLPLMIFKPDKGFHLRSSIHIRWVCVYYAPSWKLTFKMNLIASRPVFHLDKSKFIEHIRIFFQLLLFFPIRERGKKVINIFLIWHYNVDALIYINYVQWLLCYTSAGSH